MAVKYEGKPIFHKPHRFNTGWLGFGGTSITDIDLAASGDKGMNIYELKYRTPFLSKAQLELLREYQLIHLVILQFPESQNTEGQYCFEAPDVAPLAGFESLVNRPYEIYCPHCRQEVRYDEHQQSWKVISSPQAYITKDEARAIFRGDAPWPCCGRPTYPR